MKTYAVLVITLLTCLATPIASAAEGRIKGTGGVSSASGAGGGGLLPWATLMGHATREEWAGSAFLTRLDVDDFTLDVAGLGVNLRDRLELSYARRKFTTEATAARIRQDNIGLKYRLGGDLLYGSVPQIVVGVEHGILRDPATANASGAEETTGSDLYIGAARGWIDGLANRTTFLNINARYSEANQFGLLGYGGDDGDRRLHIEAAGGIFLTRSWVVGAEYRYKPDNLLALKEDAATDLFVAWFPSKHISVTAAWVNLGRIAGADTQKGFYLSLQGAL